jgi:Predicted RNA-binding protein
MSDIKEFQGKNLDEAIESACKHFDLKRDKLEIEIVSGGSSGIFGLVGVKPAIVRAKSRGSFKAMAQEVEAERKPAPRAEKAERSERAEPAVAPAARQSAPAQNTPVQKAASQAKAEAAPAAQTQAAAPAEAGAVAAGEPRAEGEGRSRRGDRGRRGGRGRGRGESRPEGGEARPEQSAEDRGGERPREERAPQGRGERQDRSRGRGRGEGQRSSEPRNSDSRRSEPRRTEPQAGGFGEEENGAPQGIAHLDQALLREVTIEVTTRLLAPLSEEAKVEIQIQSDRVLVRIDDPDNSGLLIGREGQTLASLQYLVNRLVSKRMDASVRVQIDTGDYRENQDEKLRQIARHLADKATASGRTQSTRPMSSYHRRVVHLTLQEDEFVFTRSKGEGSMKRVLIVPKQREQTGEVVEEAVQESQE